MDRDALHAKGEHAEWNESFYFNFYDRERDICAFLRLGLKPNKDEKSMFCFLLLPDGGVVGARAREPCRDNDLRAGGLALEKIAPERRWRLRFDGPMARLPSMAPLKVAMDVEFEALAPMFDYRECVSGEKELLSRSVASEHLEQYGRARGFVEINGERQAIDGLGERDRSWGIREWTAPEMWIWLTAQFSERAALNVTKLVMAGGTVDAGFVALDGKIHAIVDARIATDYGPDGGPRSLRMTLTDREGGRHEVAAEVLRKAVLPFEGDGATATMHETLARYRFGGRTGYGIAEYLIRKPGGGKA